MLNKGLVTFPAKVSVIYSVRKVVTGKIPSALYASLTTYSWCGPHGSTAPTNFLQHLNLFHPTIKFPHFHELLRHQCPSHRKTHTTVYPLHQTHWQGTQYSTILPIILMPAKGKSSPRIPTYNQQKTRSTHTIIAATQNPASLLHNHCHLHLQQSQFTHTKQTTSPAANGIHLPFIPYNMDIPQVNTFCGITGTWYKVTKPYHNFSPCTISLVNKAQKPTG